MDEEDPAENRRELHGKEGPPWHGDKRNKNKVAAKPRHTGQIKRDDYENAF